MSYALFCHEAKLSKSYPTEADVWKLARQSGLVVDAVSEHGEPVPRPMLDSGDRACSMEVSSHALELHRADAIHFATAVFTNLTQDHLDFHPTMEDYFAAKRGLFVARPASGTPAAPVWSRPASAGSRLLLRSPARA